VEENINNEIVYVHTENIGARELTKFYKDLISNEADKKGLI
jgi:hypothetical protein